MPKTMTERAHALEWAANDFIAKVERGTARSKRSYALFKAAVALDQNAWRDATKELPPQDTLVEVCGHSGMGKNKYFLTYAQHMPTYRPCEPWRDILQDSLQDYGWVPLFWRFPEPLPDMAD